MVVLVENFRAVFYAPFYAAFALHHYEMENVEVELRTSKAADQTLQSVVSGTGQVSWGGPMRLLHALNDAPRCGVVAFCEVVGRDPFYLVGRAPNPGFALEELKRKRLATVTEVPTPWYCLQHDLRLAGIEPASVMRLPGRSMAENVAALRAGEADVIQVFEPFVREAIDGGWGHVWYSAAARGPTSYTTLNSTRDFIAKNPDTILRMTKAMYRTEQWIASHDGHALAEAIARYFPDLAVETLAACCSDYKARGLWNIDPVPQRAGIEWLRDAMLACGAIRSRFSYEDLVDACFALKAVNREP